MKKFMKICAITTAVILVSGIILVAIGGLGGGVKGLTRQIMNGELSFGREDLADFDIEWDESWGWNAEWETYDLDEDRLFNGSYDIIRNEESYSQTISGDGIRNLEIELGGCEVTVSASPDGDYHIEVEDVASFQVYTRGDTLYVAGLRNGDWNRYSSMKIKLQIPTDTFFDSVDMALGAGDFTVDVLEAGELDLEVGAGRLQIGTLKVHELDCQLGAGQVEIENAVTTGDVSLELGAGELTFTGSIPGNLDAECALGNMEIHVLGSAEADHNYELECAAGNLTAGSHSYTGLVVEQEIRNGAASDYELQCAMGNLTLTFE